MGKSLLLFTGMMLISVVASGQVHQITFSHTPPPIPIADAGPDTMITYNIPYVLPGSVTGGTPPFTYLWQPGTYLDDSTVLNPTFIFPMWGLNPEVLILTVTDQNGCVSSDQVTINGYINSVTEAAVSPIRIFPNPSSGVIHIEGLPAIEISTEIAFYSAAGKLLFTKTYSHRGGTLEADLQPVNPGFYILSVQYGEYRYMQKIIIQ